MTDATATVRFRQPPVNRPEQALIGIQYTSNVDWYALVDYVVQNSGHTLDGFGPHRADARIQKVTENVRSLFLGGPLASSGTGTLASAAPGSP